MSTDTSLYSDQWIQKQGHAGCKILRSIELPLHHNLEISLQSDDLSDPSLPLHICLCHHPQGSTDNGGLVLRSNHGDDTEGDPCVMPRKTVCCRRRIACDTGVENASMLLRPHSPSTRRVQCVDATIPFGVIGKLCYQADKAISSVSDETTVKSAVGHTPPFVILDHRIAFDLAEFLFEGLEVGGREPWNGQANPECLQGDTSSIKLLQIHERKASNMHALSGFPDDEPLMLQQTECFPQGSATDA